MYLMYMYLYLCWYIQPSEPLEEGKRKKRIPPGCSPVNAHEALACFTACDATPSPRTRRDGAAETKEL